MTDAMLVLTTLPDSDAAAEMAKKVVGDRLAACANILPALRSIYRWQGKLQDENEVLVLLKTRQQQFERLKERIVELHPYTCRRSSPSRWSRGTRRTWTGSRARPASDRSERTMTSS